MLERFHPRLMCATMVDEDNYVIVSDEKIEGYILDGMIKTLIKYDPLTLYFKRGKRDTWYVHPTIDQENENLRIGLVAQTLNEYMTLSEQKQTLPSLPFQFIRCFHRLLVAGHRQYKINSLL